MKIRINLFILSIIVLAFFISSCEDDDADNMPTKSKTQLISENPWVLDRATMEPGIEVAGFPFTDASMFLEACMKDNTYNFKTDSTISMDEGATKCDSTAEQTIDNAGTWHFNEAQTEIIFTDNEYFEGMTLKELTATDLVLTRIEVLPDTTITFGDNEITIIGGEQTFSLIFEH